jgi:hypothetical protein
MDNFLKVPKQLTSVTALETATFISIGLNYSTKPLIEYDLVNVVNQQDVFERERIAVRDYRFSGKLNVYTANELSPTTRVDNGDDTFTVTNGALNEDWDPLFDGEPQITPNNWLLQIVYPHEKDGDFTISYIGANSTISSRADMGPQINGLTLATPNGDEEKLGVTCLQKHNLNIGDDVYLYSRNIPQTQYLGIHKVISLGIEGKNTDTEFVLDVPFNVDDFIPCNYRKIVNATERDINFENSIEINAVTATDQDGGVFGTFTNIDEIYLKIETQDPHNLIIPFSSSASPNSGQPGAIPLPLEPEFISPYIDLRGGGILNGIFKVEAVVNANIFIIKYVLFTASPLTSKGQNQTYINNKPTFRTLDGTASEYYIRKYKVLSTNKYDTYKCAFSSSIYPKTLIDTLGVANDTWLYHFNEDIDVGPLVDHNNKPLTELYLGFIKRSGQNTFPWSAVESGWDFNSTTISPANSLETISNFVIGGVGTIEKPNNLFDYIGDYSEYNSIEIEEKVISKVVHRFAQKVDPSAEGYYLEPFKKLQIMNFSGIIETSSINEPTVGIPNYAEKYPNGGIAWKDLLSIGIIEPDTGKGVEYPFVNGKHYFYGGYNFYIRRQIPKEDKKINQTDLRVGDIQEVC